MIKQVLVSLECLERGGGWIDHKIFKGMDYIIVEHIWYKRKRGEEKYGGDTEYKT